MKSLILSFFKDETGATAIEYGLIAAGIAIAIITAVQGVGTELSGNFVMQPAHTEARPQAGPPFAPPMHRFLHRVQVHTLSTAKRSRFSRLVSQFTADLQRLLIGAAPGMREPALNGRMPGSLP